MDEQMARYRRVVLTASNYYIALTDQVQLGCGSAVGLRAYAQTESVVPVFLAMIGIHVYGLRGYAKLLHSKSKRHVTQMYP